MRERLSAFAITIACSGGRLSSVALILAFVSSFIGYLTCVDYIIKKIYFTLVVALLFLVANTEQGTFSVSILTDVSANLKCNSLLQNVL